MNKIQKALQKLQTILPIEENLEKLNHQQRQFYYYILDSFANNTADFQNFSQAKKEDLKTLSQYDMVILDAEGLPCGIYPMTKENRGFNVLLNSQNINAMCALDSLAISLMFQQKVIINAHCVVSKQPIQIKQNKTQIDTQDDLIFFGIDWQKQCSSSSCASSLCQAMIFLKDEHNAVIWQEQNKENREIFDLKEALEFSSSFFMPLLKYKEK